MNRTTHPVEREEVMAYLDGQLEAARAKVVAAHVEECAECRALAMELRGVSERLAAWQVEPAAPAQLSEKVTAALPAQPAKAKAQAKQPRGPFIRAWVWQLGAVAAVLLVVAALSIPNLLRSRMAESQRETGLSGPTDAAKVGAGSATLGRLQPDKKVPGGPAGPMIIRTASLVIYTKEFDNTRAAMEEVLRKQGGYIAQLSTSGRSAGGRSLTATVRVPADKLDATLAELKKLGRVESESQGGEEVTQQYVDLVARLENARHTEQRLVEVLRQRTGKVRDVLEVEREIARVREEIERMEAQRKNIEKQVEFATVNLRLNEEYEAQVNPPRPATSILLWNATVEGYHSARESALGLALFLLRYGPALLFWFAVLFWPARFVWRRLRAEVA